MIRLTTSRRRVAALASSALAAGALTMLPATLGASSASAAPVELDYTCVIPGFGGGPAQDVASTLDIDVTTAGYAWEGRTFKADVEFTLDMSPALMGPVATVDGELDIDLLVDGEPVTVSVPTDQWVKATTPTLVMTGAGQITLTAPDEPGDIDIDVANVALDSSAFVPLPPPNGTTTDFDVPCTPEPEQEQTVAGVDVWALQGMDCVMTPPGTAPEDATHIPSGATVDLGTVPAAVTAGETFSVPVTATLDLGKTYLGPVTGLTGSLGVELFVGNEATTVSIPIAPFTVPPGSNPGNPAQILVGGTATVSVAAPAGEPNELAIRVGDVTGNFIAATPFGPNPTTIPCTADEVEDPALGSIVSEATPEGLKYHCDYGDFDPFPAYLVTELTNPLPETVKEDAVLNPAVTTTLTWGRFWANSSRSIEAAYQEGTATLSNAAGGDGALTFSSTAVPASGAMVWNATGTFGAVDTATPGDVELELGDLELKVKTKNKFTGPAFLPATITCELLPDQDASLGAVEIEEVPDVAPTSAPKVTGALKVGQKLTAAAAFTPSGTTVAYQWLRNGASISGAKAVSYTLTAADLGKTISVRITASKTDFETYTGTVNAGKVAAGTQTVIGKAKVTGTPKVTKTLTAVPGTATGAKVTYQWLSNGKVLKGATGKTLKLARALKGKRISVKVTYTRVGYTTVTQTSNVVTVR